MRQILEGFVANYINTKAYTVETDMGTLFALLALCVGNPRHAHKGPTAQSSDVFCCVHLSERLTKQLSCR